MATIDHEVQDRAARAAEKYEARRDELAEAALQTLSQLGYARTGLRDIAANSNYSHGVVHYYFEDKIDLILTGVRRYKARCVTRYDDIVDRATTADELAEGFAEAVSATLRDDAHLHRLWYDLRSQSYFAEDLREDVLAIDGLLLEMIWRVVSRYLELLGRETSVSPIVAYGTFDGIFQYHLLRQLTGPVLLDGDTTIRTDIRAALEQLAA